MKDTNAKKIDELDLWCSKYGKSCKDVPMDGRCHKCCTGCMKSE